MRPFALLSLALVALACGGTLRTQTMSSRPVPWTISYADGSANSYTFMQADPGGGVSFEYAPVTPETSSTGTYSGGDPVKKTLHAGDPRLDELWRRVEALEADRSQHITERRKGTGALRVTTAEEERVTLIERAPPLLELEALLRGFR